MGINRYSKATELIIEHTDKIYDLNSILRSKLNKGQLTEEQRTEIAKAIVTSYDQNQAKNTNRKNVIFSVFMIPAIISVLVLLDQYCFSEKFKSTASFALALSSGIILPLILMGFKSFFSKGINQEPKSDMRIMEIECELSDRVKILT